MEPHLSWIVVAIASGAIGVWIGMLLPSTKHLDDIQEALDALHNQGELTQDILRGLSHEEAKRHKEEMAKD